MSRERAYRTTLPSGSWFGVQSAPAFGSPDEGYEIAVGRGFGESGTWTVVGPMIVSRVEADSIAMHLFYTLLPHARAEDVRKQERGLA